MRSASLRSAALRSASARVASVRLAPLRSAPLSLAGLRSAPSRSAPRRAGRTSLCSLRHAFHSSTPRLRIARCSGFAMGTILLPARPGARLTPGRATAYSAVKERWPFRPSWLAECDPHEGRRQANPHPVAHPVAHHTDVQRLTPVFAAPIHPDAHDGQSWALPWTTRCESARWGLPPGSQGAQPARRAFTSRGTYSTGSPCCISHRSTSVAKNRQHRRPPIL